MHRHARPIVVASKCLEIAVCRYNGQAIRAPLILSLAEFAEVRPVCPEVEIGLGIPRDPIRLVALEGTHRLVQPSTGRDVTAAMKDFGETFLASAGEVDGFVLKSRSPSCGIKDTKLYGSPDEAQPIGKGPGLFGDAVLQRFPHAAVEDEGRLTDFRLRHHFLTKLFGRAAFRTVQSSGSMGQLVQFHTANKFLLMAYHQRALKTLGRIVANAERRPVRDVVSNYEVHLSHALARPARSTSNINVLMHAMGYVSDGLSPREKRHFLEMLQQYRAKRVSLSAPLTVLQSWIARFEQEYLAGQTYFQPYPKELVDLGDSGPKRRFDHELRP